MAASCTEMDATSAGWPRRGRGVSAPKLTSFSIVVPPLTCKAVHIGPGAAPFTRIPLAESCIANERTKLVLAAFFRS